MRPKKNDEDENHRWSWNKKIVLPESNIKYRKYIVVFKDDPKQLQHQITIVQNDKMYTYDVRFVKPLIHPITKSNTYRDSITCNNLNELKKLLRSYLKNFGEYKITPID